MLQRALSLLLYRAIDTADHALCSCLLTGLEVLVLKAKEEKVVGRPGVPEVFCTRHTHATLQARKATTAHANDSSELSSDLAHCEIKNRERGKESGDSVSRYHLYQPRGLSPLISRCRHQYRASLSAREIKCNKPHSCSGTLLRVPHPPTPYGTCPPPMSVPDIA
eukprot:1801398-Rhodomonas_salina.1